MAEEAGQDVAAEEPVAVRRTLPPGQRRIEGFPRFGTHLHLPAPPIPEHPEILIEGAVSRSFAVPLSELQDLPHREQSADFHCVAGWSATDLRWEGVPFDAFYRLVVAPAVPEGTSVTHLAFTGLDGYRAVMSIEDALAPGVLLAQRLNERPLCSDHGAPLRLVSPEQYGFLSTKHLCRIELLTAAPTENYGSAGALGRMLMFRPVFNRHPRSRVWYEERNASLPAWMVRPIYRTITPLIAALCARGAQRDKVP